MYRFFLAAVDVVPAAVVLIPLFGVLHFTVYCRDLKKSVLYCLFCLYMAAVFSLVGIPNVIYFRPQVNVNLIPFQGMVDDFKNSILNVALFIPFGFFVPLLWQKYRSVTTCVAAGFCMSFIIELLQMLTYRATDVNDLITNTAGTLLGFLLAKRLTAKVPAVEEGHRDIIYLTVLSFCVMFFVHPFLSPLIWDRIL